MSGNKLLPTVLLVFVISLFLQPEINAQERDVPYVPTPNSVVEEMLDVANVGPGDYVIDLGSGDGRIVIAAAKRGAFGHGVDIDPKRVREAKENALKAGVEDKVVFIEGNIFNTDFSRASVITMYLLHSVNMKLRPYLLRNLKPGTRVVSHDFDMSDWKPDKHFIVDSRGVYFWIIPANVEGQWSWRAGGERYIMTASQEFQEIQLSISSGNSSLSVDNCMLSGEKISFNAVNPSNGDKYVYNGRVDGKNITGTVQIRTGNNSTVENWTATLE